MKTVATNRTHVTHAVTIAAPTSQAPTGSTTPVAAPRPVLLREVIGVHLRSARTRQGLTLRQVSAKARVSLGYLSEVERGQKEASSELLAAICGALDLSLADLLIEVSADVARRTHQFASLLRQR